MTRTDNIKGGSGAAQPGASRSRVRVSPRTLATPEPPEHLTDGTACWCQPTRDRLDPEVFIHRRVVQ